MTHATGGRLPGVSGLDGDGECVASGNASFRAALTAARGVVGEANSVRRRPNHVAPLCVVDADFVTTEGLTEERVRELVESGKLVLASVPRAFARGRRCVVWAGE
jgi:hypothetical protein